MKRILIIVIFFYSISFIYSDDERYYFVDNGMIGYFNSDRQIVIPARYTYATPFNDGHAIVNLSRYNFAVINPNGDIIFRFFSENEYPRISDGMIIFTHNRIDGFYNLKGEIVLDGYERASNFTEGSAVIMRGKKSYYIDKSGDPYFKDKDIQPDFDYARPFKNGLALIRNIRNGKDYYGFINKSGDYVISDKYVYLGDYFTDGLCVAAIEYDYQRTKKGVIDINEEWIIPPKYYDIRIISKELFIVRYQDDTYPRGYWKLIDNKENDIKIFNPGSVATNTIINGNMILLSAKNSDAYFLVDFKGEFIFNGWFERIYMTQKGNYTSIVIKGKDAIITPEGKIVFNKDFFKD